MQERQLGKSDVKVTQITLGTWAIGGIMWGGTDENEATRAIQTSLDEGIRTIDTAAIYGMGFSESVVGKAIRGRRDQAVIATKCGLRWDSAEGTDPSPAQDLEGKPCVIRKNSKPASIIYECEQSLKRLNTDHIDLYQIHWPDISTSIEESWHAMVKLKKQGKVRAIGVSNYSLEQLARAHAEHPVDSVQLPYSLIRRGIESDIVPFCQKNHIGILAYSSLERGLLTGKVTEQREFKEGDHRKSYDLFSLANRKRILKALDKIRPIAEKHRATIAQVIIHCTMFMPGITTALVGARNSSQARENAHALRIRLSLEERAFVVEQLAEKDLQR